MSTQAHYHYLKHRTSKRNKETLNILVWFAVVAGPIMTIPQIYTIWVEGTKGASLLSWAAYLVVAFIWLIYGLVHRERPIVIAQTAWILLDSTIVVGLIINR